MASFCLSVGCVIFSFFNKKYIYIVFKYNRRKKEKKMKSSRVVGFFDKRYLNIHDNYYTTYSLIVSVQSTRFNRFKIHIPSLDRARMNRNLSYCLALVLVSARFIISSQLLFGVFVVVVNFLHALSTNVTDGARPLVPSTGLRGRRSSYLHNCSDSMMTLSV